MCIFCIIIQYYKHYTNIILYSFYIRQYIVYILSACGLNMFSEGILV